MEQWTGSQLGKEYDQAVSCHPVYLTYMQNTSYEILGWMKSQAARKIAGRNINLRDAADTSLAAECEENKRDRAS